MSRLSGKSESELVEGLELYIKNGYVDPYYINCESFDEGADEADEYLQALDAIDCDLSNAYRRKIMESHNVNNDFFKSLCMNRLLFSSTDRAYVFHYLNEYSDGLPIPMLQEAMFYFYCAKNDPDDEEHVLDALVRKLKARYEVVKDARDSTSYEQTELAETYENFSKAYPQL